VCVYSSLNQAFLEVLMMLLPLAAFKCDVF